MTPWTGALQAPLSMRFFRQEYWSGLPFPSPGDLSNPGIEPRSPVLQAYSLWTEPPGKTDSKVTSKVKCKYYCEPFSTTQRGVIFGVISVSHLFVNFHILGLIVPKALSLLHFCFESLPLNLLYSRVARYNTGCSVKIEFQINKESICSV